MADRILFKLVEPEAVTLPGDAAALAAAAEGVLAQVLGTFGLPAAVPLLADLDRDEVQAAVDEARAANPGQEMDVPNPLLAFAVEVDPNGSFTPLELANLVRDLQPVEWAQADETAGVSVNPSANPEAARQTYLDPSPDGVDMAVAWAQPGGDGAGIKVGVVEAFHFDDQHRDKPISIAALTPSPSFGPVPVTTTDLAHATRVVGILAAADNTLDCVGLVPSCSMLFAAGSKTDLSIDESEIFLLMHRVGFQLGAGDVLNLSLSARAGQPPGEYPLDMRPVTRSAARLLTFRGTTVVQAAGNGVKGPCQSINLDQALPSGLVPSNATAVVVGGMEFSGFGHPQRWACSTFGARVDCCAPAEDVLAIEPNDTVDVQDGTSFATPIISGVVAAMQGIRQARGNPPLTPLEVKTFLKDRTLTTAEPDASEGVGGMPNLAAIVPLL